MAGLIGASNSPISGVGILSIVLCASALVVAVSPTPETRPALVRRPVFDRHIGVHLQSSAGGAKPRVYLVLDQRFVLPQHIAQRPRAVGDIVARQSIHVESTRARSGMPRYFGGTEPPVFAARERGLRMRQLGPDRDRSAERDDFRQREALGDRRRPARLRNRAVLDQRNPFAFRRIDALPRTALGKIQKHLLPATGPDFK